MFTALDLLIGLSFIFLLFSLVVTALSELILAKLDKRATFLQEGLLELLKNREQVEKLCNHGLINALAREGSSRPSYIGPTTFTTALFDVIAIGRAAKMEDVRAVLDKLPEKKLRQSLLALADEAGDNLQAFRAAVEVWYGCAMDRVSGWYKRYSQQWAFGLAFLLAVACNVDAIRIAKTLSTDDNLRASLVEQAGQRTNAGAAPSDSPDETARLRARLDELNGIGVPIGWSSDVRPDFGFKVGPEEWATPDQWNWGDILTSLFGWLFTALAATLGAPFWFDLLNRFVTIRGNGRAPDEKPLPGRSDPAATATSPVGRAAPVVTP